MPFANAHHGDGDGERLDLAARIDAELRARIEDAVDCACLDAMVEARCAQGAAPPVADDPRDREEFMARVGAFIERLRVEIVAGLGEEQRRRLGETVLAPPAGDLGWAVSVQAALARELPDYWQRFDAIRLRPPVEPSGSGAMSSSPHSGGERRGLLDRLLRRR